jgi:DDE superfamily endonuclease
VGVDDTGFPKDGICSVGVQRQYSGTLGKTANCQLGVSVNAVTEQASCPLDWRLFVPESWDDDPDRRAACHLPERVRHRPEWQLGLDLVPTTHQRPVQRFHPHGRHPPHGHDLGFGALERNFRRGRGRPDARQLPGMPMRGIGRPVC